MNIYQAVIASSYGHGSTQPLRAACIRLACLWTGAIMIGLLVAGNFSGIPPSPRTNPYLIFPTIMIVQVTVIITLISTQAIGIGKSDTLTRIFAVLPLTDMQRWLLFLLPPLLLVGLSLTLLVWPAATVLLALGLPLPLFILGVIVGSLTALGMIYALPSKYALAKYALMAMILWFEYRAAGRLSAATSDNMLATALLIGLFTCLIALFFASKSWVVRSSSTPKQHMVTTGTGLPAELWFLKKMLRSSSTRHGFVMAFSLSFILAWVCSKEQFMGSSVPAMAVCLIAASYTSDTRALCRRFNPPEIVTLQGTAYFIGRYVASSVLAGALTSIPWVLISLQSQPAAHAFGLGCVAVLGASIGTVASTLIIPEPRDITSQFLTTLVCIGLAGLFLKSSAGNLYSAPVLLAEACASLFCLACTYGIEYKRNSYKWRNHDTNQHITT